MQAPDPQLDGAVPQTGEDVALILGRSVVLRDPRFARAAARGLLGGPAGTPCLGPFLGALVLPRGLGRPAGGAGIGGVGGKGGLDVHADCCRAWGGATSLRILVITVRAAVPANSASGSSTKRCSHTGSTRCLTSSGITSWRPWTSAQTLTVR